MKPELLLDAATSSLEQGRAALRATVAALGERVAGAHGPDAGLDAYQGEALALAHLHAQVFAAGELTVYGQTGEPEALLAASFGGATLRLLREQLAHLALQLRPGGGSLAAFLTDERASALIRDTSQPAFHARLLDALENSGGARDSVGEEHRMLRETFRAFADRKVRPLAERIHRGDELIPDSLIREAAELGCFGLSIPLDYGGVQERPDNVGMVVVTEELCRGALIVGSLITRPEILAKALLKGGTEEQRRRFLPAMASGEKMVAISVTEPNFGSDVAGITCSARPDGEVWRLNGAKTWCTFAGRAELIGLLARSEPDGGLGSKGLSLFVLEKPPFRGHDFEHAHALGGRMTGRAIATLGYRGMHSYELSFDNYPVPAANLVGGEAGRGRGFYLQMEGFAYGRLQTAGRALGVMQAAWEAARSYARDRSVFGKPLAARGLTREKLARMAATLEACRQATYAAARLLDGAAGTGRGQMEASLVKFLACRQAEWITREAQQLHGGMGYAEEFPVSRWFVDARVLSIFEGAEEVLGLKVIAPALLRGAGAG